MDDQRVGEALPVRDRVRVGARYPFPARCGAAEQLPKLVDVDKVSQLLTVDDLVVLVRRHAQDRRNVPTSRIDVLYVRPVTRYRARNA